ncbi:MAG: SH3 domain-containing protein [Novosphingobium sp.]
MSKRLLFALLAASLTVTPAIAAEEGVPYWASIRASEVNMRVGPGEDYRINWVYRRPHLPMKVLRTMEGWRLVQDPDGARGWMLARFLSRERGAIVRGNGLAEMREKGDDEARVLWKLRPGVVGKLGDCKEAWCRFEVGGHTGFIPQDRVWGAGEP